MTILTLAGLSLSILGLCLSIAALFVALRGSGRSLSKRLNEHSALFSELGDELTATNARIRSLRAQMHASKLNTKANDAETESTFGSTEQAKDEWTRRTNLALATGQLRTPYMRR